MDNITHKQIVRLQILGTLSAVILLTGCSKEEPEAALPPPPVAAPVSLTGPQATPAAPVAPDAIQSQAQTPAGPTPTLDQLPKAPTGAEQITLEQLSNAIQQYVGAHQIDPGAFTEKDLPKLVTEQFIAYWTPPPPGKKYVWNAQLQVSLADR